MKKMKKMADGGLTDQDISDKLARLGLQGGTRDYALAQKQLRAGKTAQELENLLPSREKIGSALRGRLDPETVMDTINPVGAIARRAAKAAEGAQMPRSYADAGGMKKGGFVSHSDHVKKHAAGFKHHDDHVKAMCGGGYMGKKAK